MDTSSWGPAIFSTHLGQYAIRNTCPPNIMLRSNPNDDQDDMVAKLQSMFPLQCKAITAPITNIYDYFDFYDAHRHGSLFLESVLATIAAHNFKRAQMVQNFVENWRQDNPRLYNSILSRTEVFSDADVKYYGSEFLGEAHSLLRSLRMNRYVACNANRPNQNTPPASKSRSTRSITPVSVRGRLSSVNASRQKPEMNTQLSHEHAYGTPQQPQMALPPDSNTVQPANQSHKYGSLQQAERVFYPARRDFHSDPEDYIRQIQKYVTDPIIAIPSAGQSGPFSYQHVPLNYRVIPRPASGAMRNPAKPVSDDARVLEMQEAASRGVPRDTSNPGVPPYQQPANVSCGNWSGYGLQDSTLHSLTSPIFHQQAASYPLDRDPAVISVGIKTHSGVNEYHYPQADNNQGPTPKGEALQAVPIIQADSYERLSPGNYGLQPVPIEQYHALKLQPSVPITSEVSEKDNRAESKIAANIHRAYQKPPTYQDGEPFRQKTPWDTRASLPNRSDTLSEVSSLSQRSLQNENDYHQNQPSKNKVILWIGGLYPDTTQAQLAQIFEPFGEISEISHLFNRGEGSYAFVSFKTAEATAQALTSLNLKKPEGFDWFKVRYSIHNQIPGNLKVKHLRNGSENPRQEKSNNLKENLPSTGTVGKEKEVAILTHDNRPVPPTQSALSPTKILLNPRLEFGEVPKTSNTALEPRSRDNDNLSFAKAWSGKTTIDPSEIRKDSENSSKPQEEVNFIVPERRKSSEPEQVIINRTGASAMEPNSGDNDMTKSETMSRDDKVPTPDARDKPNLVVPKPSSGPTSLHPFSRTRNPTHPKKGKQAKQAKKQTRQQETSRKKEEHDFVAAAQGLNMCAQQDGVDIAFGINTDVKPVSQPDQSDSNLSETQIAPGILDKKSPLIPADTTLLTSDSEISKMKPLEPSSRDVAGQKTDLDIHVHLKTLSNETSPGAPLAHIEEGSQLTPKTTSGATTDISKTDSSAVPPCHSDAVIARSSIAEPSIILQNQSSLDSRDLKGPKISTSANDVVSTKVPNLPQVEKDEPTQVEKDEPTQVEKDEPTQVKRDEPSPLKRDGPTQVQNGRSRTPPRERPTLPSTPVITHKKKRKSFTPEKIVESVCYTPTSDGSPSAAEANPSETQEAAIDRLLAEEKRAVGITSDIPETMGDKDELNREDKLTASVYTEPLNQTQDRQTSPSSHPTKENKKKSRKSKSKAKSKADRESSQTSAIPSGEVCGTSASYVRSLPPPETPFLVGDEFIKPSVEKDGKTIFSDSIRPSVSGEEPSGSFRKDISQYHSMKDRVYWPEIVKAMQKAGGLSVPDQTSSKKRRPESFRNVGEPGVPCTQPTASGDSKSLAFEEKSREIKRTSISMSADDESNHASITEPKTRKGNVPHYQLPTAGQTEESLPDGPFHAETTTRFWESLFVDKYPGPDSPLQPISAFSDLSPSTSDGTLLGDHLTSATNEMTDKPVADSSSRGDVENDSDSQTDRIIAKTAKVSLASVAPSNTTETPGESPPVCSQNVQGSLEPRRGSESRSPPHTPLITYTSATSESLSSLETPSDDSSESSNTECRDWAIEKSEEQTAADEAEYVSYFAPRGRLYSLFPTYPEAFSSQTQSLPELQYGDVVELEPTDGGERMQLKLDEAAGRITDEIGVERNHVERRDPAVVAEKEHFGHMGNVWIASVGKYDS